MFSSTIRKAVIADRLWAAGLAIVVGALHRSAVARPWADDRVLPAEPEWFQLAAPLMHSTVTGSASLANGLVRMLDPWTTWSSVADARGLAACLAAVAAAALFVGLRRWNVGRWIAVPLACVPAIGLVLPTSSATIVAHGLQTLVASAFALVALEGDPPTGRRLGLLTVLGLVGAANHASFLPFALVLWAGLAWHAWRAGVSATVTGLAAMGAAWLVAACSLRLQLTASHGALAAAPNPLAMALALPTGRFAPAFQPSATADGLSAVVGALPAPLIVCAPLALLALLRRDTRAEAGALAAAGLALATFTWGTWLPDPRVASAAITVAAVLLAGLALRSLADRHAALAAVSAVFVGAYGFIGRTPSEERVDARRLEAFVGSASAAIGTGAWCPERLAIDRALLLESGAPRRTRLPARAHALRALAEDTACLVFPEAQAQLERAGVWTAPLDLPYQSAAAFVAAQPERAWIALAVRDAGERTNGFARDVLRVLVSGPSSMSDGRAVALGTADRDPGGVGVSSPGRLAVRFDQALGRSAARSPARFVLEADPLARVVVNGEVAAQTLRGAALVVFDPWLGGFDSYVLGQDERGAALPALRDPRLTAAVWLGIRGPAEPTRVPVVAGEPVRVAFDASGDGWFGDGWHGPEGPNADTFRWTRARTATVRVLVSRRQPLRVMLRGSVATAPRAPNALGVAWNGEPLQPLTPWSHSRRVAWDVPASSVQRGLNLLTVQVERLVSPADVGTGGDTRLLGAAIESLTFEPGGAPQGAPRP